MKKIVLSSNSPRRKELLGELGIDFEVRVIEGIDETYPKELSVEEVPQYIAREKARVYIVGKDEVLLTADTVVVWVTILWESRTMKPMLCVCYAS